MTTTRTCSRDPLLSRTGPTKEVSQSAARKQAWLEVLSAGVLMMGYELYRQLSNKKSRKKKGKTYPSLEENREKNESSLYG